MTACTGTSRPRVFIVDDHRLLAQSLALTLRAQGVDAAVVDVAALADADSLLAAVVKADPTLVLLDLDLGPGAVAGEVLVAPLVASGYRVLVVTGSIDPERIAAVLQNGAVDVIEKSADLEHLISVTVACARGQHTQPPTARRQITDAAKAQRLDREHEQAPFALLSAREARVLHRLTRGESVTQIAAVECVAPATVRSQVRGILTKLGVNSQLSAVALARKVGWNREGS